MEVKEYKLDSHVVMELKGRVDEYNTETLFKEINIILNTGKKTIIIDLSSTDELSAHCLNAIWKAQRRAISLGGEILLCGASGHVLETIYFVDFDRVLHRFENIKRALEFFARADYQPPEECLSKLPLWRRLIYRAFDVIFVFLFFCALPETASADSLNLQDFKGKEQHAFTLEETLDLARMVSPLSRLALLKEEERRSALEQARGQSLPKLILTGGYVYQSNPTILSDIIQREVSGVRSRNTPDLEESTNTNTEVRFEDDTMLLSLGFSQVLNAGGIFEERVRLMAARVKESKAIIQLEQIRSEDKVRDIFMGLLLAQQKVELYEAYKKSLESRLKALKKALSSQVISNTTYSEVEIQYLKTERQLLETARDEKNLRSTMNITLGRKEKMPFYPKMINKYKDFQPEEAEKYMERATHRYPGLLKAMALLESSRAYQNVIRAEQNFVPKTTLFGTTEYTKGLGNSHNAFSWTLGIAFLVPLFDGGRSKARLDQAVSLARQAKISYERGEFNLRLLLSDTINNIKQASIGLMLAEKQHKIAKEREQQALNAVEQNIIPQYRAIEAKARSLEAKIRKLGAIAERIRWIAKLSSLVGGGLCQSSKC